LCDVRPPKFVASDPLSNANVIENFATGYASQDSYGKGVYRHNKAL
jgi:hypothetical protein